MASLGHSELMKTTEIMEYKWNVGIWEWEKMCLHLAIISCSIVVYVIHISLAYSQVYSLTLILDPKDH